MSNFFWTDSNIDEENFWNNFSRQAVGNKTFFSVSDDLIFDTVSIPSSEVKLFISFGDPSISRSPRTTQTDERQSWRTTEQSPMVGGFDFIQSGLEYKKKLHL